MKRIFCCIFFREQGKLHKGFGIGLVLLLCLSFLSYAFVMHLFGFRNTSEYVFASEERIEIEIPTGATTKKIAAVLHERELIRFPFLFRIISKGKGYDGQYKSGVHEVSKNMTYQQMMRALGKNPKNFSLTIPEGLNVKQVAALFASKKLANQETILNLMDAGNFDFKFIQKIPVRKNRLEGYLFPDTYQFGLNETPESMIKKILLNFDKKFKEEYYKQAENMGYTLDEIIKMASIIEREAYHLSDQKRIAGVFYNRLKSKDAVLKRLQSCATIQYILFMRNGVMKEVLSEKDTQIDDVFNTYLHTGLPPGPIASPGLHGIEAALYPEAHDYYYFVAKKDKTHAFAKTYAEHLENVRKFGG